MCTIVCTLQTHCIAQLPNGMVKYYLLIGNNMNNFMNIKNIALGDFNNKNIFNILFKTKSIKKTKQNK